MGKDFLAWGAHKTKMDQFTAPGAGGGLQLELSEGSQDMSEPSGAQILAATEASGQAVQAKNEAMALYVNLLRSDLPALVERFIAMEQQVTTMQTELDALKPLCSPLRPDHAN
ncbi:hypothetical protein NDU88_003453 [Pleurodeles waltl]|uniref:Uncharacterized protein n=1 Tax=Pleurodeles waltl TaxID=8319 RepID=A0AAV7MB35_PLEWA|nr:hypothetical protein NDU88_003453 [Pleurodeles waltl]